MEIAELKTKTIADLLKIAEAKDIPGVSGLRKSELRKTHRPPMG